MIRRKAERLKSPVLIQDSPLPVKATQKPINTQYQAALFHVATIILWRLTMKKITALSKINPQLKGRALTLLESDEFMSLQQYETNEFEALIRHERGIWLPEIEVLDDAIDDHCQCCKDGVMCVHKVAMLIAINLIDASDIAGISD
jgi:hypothetical protein